MIDEAAVKRFWDNVQKSPGCWLWTAAKRHKGYGAFNVRGENFKAHRLAWELTYGPIPKGMHVCHRCDTPSCVNPTHLFLGTNQDNVADMFQKGRNSPPPNMAGWNRLELPSELIDQLGKVPDLQLAKRYGFGKHVIQRRRRRLGIPACPVETKFKCGMPHPRWSRKGGSSPA